MLLVLVKLVRVARSLHSFLDVATEGLAQLSLAVAQRRVPVVLDGVVAAADQDICDFCPPIMNGLLKYVQNPIFLDAPGAFLEQRVQLVVPALSALLARAFGHFLGDQLPLVRAELSDDFDHEIVLLIVPGPLA